MDLGRRKKDVDSWRASPTSGQLVSSGGLNYEQILSPSESCNFSFFPGLGRARGEEKPPGSRAFWPNG